MDVGWMDGCMVDDWYSGWLPNKTGKRCGMDVGWMDVWWMTGIPAGFQTRLVNGLGGLVL